LTVKAKLVNDIWSAAIMDHRDSYSRLLHYSSTLSVRQHKKKVSLC